MSDCRTRCVLLAPKGEGADDGAGSVQSMLDRRGWIAHEAHDLLTALAELCLLERTQASRESWGPGPQERLALVVVEPDRWDELPAMLSAARRYVPGAALWTVVDGGLHPLPAPAGGDAGVGARTGTAPVTPPAPSAGDDRIPPPPVSGAEIDMLLQHDPQEPTE